MIHFSDFDELFLSESVEYVQYMQKSLGESKIFYQREEHFNTESINNNQPLVMLGYFGLGNFLSIWVFPNIEGNYFLEKRESHFYSNFMKGKITLYQSIVSFRLFSEIFLSGSKSKVPRKRRRANPHITPPCWTMCCFLLAVEKFQNESHLMNGFSSIL